MHTLSNLPPVEDSELVLEELFRHTPVGVVLSDLHGNILDANPALCAMLGFERAELIGHKIVEMSHPDDVQDVLARTSDLRDGRSGHYMTTRRYIARGGAIVHAKVSVSLVYSKSGEAVCGIGFIENITERVTMEDALRRSEVRYRRVVEDQTELIVRCLPDGTRTFVNEAYCRYNASTAEELLGVSFLTCMNEEEQQIVRAKFAALTPAQPVITDQHWVTDPSGAQRWHEWTDRGFFDEHGTLIEIQSVGRDLTEQHEAQQRLVESENRYRRLFNNLPVAVWENDWSELVAEFSRRGFINEETLIGAMREDPSLFRDLASRIRITAVNPAALAMAGVADLEAFKHWRDTSAERESTLRMGRMALKLIFDETSSQMDEFTMIRATGEPIEILLRIARSERWGVDHRISTIAIDVTERKRTERELLHKQQMTERAEAAAHLGTWEWNKDQNMVYGSSEFWRILDGREDGGPSERPMRDCLARFHPDDAANAMATWSSLLAPSAEARPAVFENDYRVLRDDGPLATARAQNFLVFGPDGAIVRAFGILRDITAVTRAEEEAARHRDELIRADKMISLGILVSGMAHEINNPNHAIGLNAPLVRQAWRDASALLDELASANDDLRIGHLPWSEARREVAGMLDDIEHASERIRNIVTELRGFALDHEPGERAAVSVNDIVNGSLRLLGKHIARATKSFHLELAPNVPLIAGNSRRLEQVVVNLVINACQSLRRDDRAIHIQTGADGTRAYIRVIDEGEGIAAADLPKIRTPFFTTRRSAGGTGLGLAVSDRIAGEHGGELTFESEPGRGTTATLWLPIGGA